MFVFDAITVLAVDTPASTVTLSGSSICVILAALGEAEQMWNWLGASDRLSADEIDQIKAMVALAEHEVMG